MKPLFNKRDFDSIFHDKLHNYQARPSSRVWDGIEGQLNNVSPFQYYLKWVGVAAGVLVLMATSLFLSNRTSSTDGYRAATLNNTGIIRSININLPENTTIAGSVADEDAVAGINTLTGNTNNRPGHIKKGIGNNSRSTTFAAGNIKKGTKRSSGKDAELAILNEISNAQILLDESGEADYLSAFLASKLNKELNAELPILTNLTYRRNSTLDDSHVTGFHVGPIVAFNNTWVLNRDIDSRNFNDHFKYKMKFGVSYGFAVGYDFSGRYGVELDWIVNSNEGQTFETKTELGTKDLKAKLNYTRIPLIFKYRMSKLSKYNATPMAINYLVGVQYGRLNWVNIDEEIGFIRPDDFNTHEWGVIFGLEYDLYFGNNYSVSLGGRGSVTTDANTFPLLMNDDFSKPHNFSIGISAKFNYLLKPKQ